MASSFGLVGLPNAGKSTVFNALTAAGALVASYPFSTVTPNRGVVQVPDERLDRLFVLVSGKDKTPTTIEFFDIAGLVKGASEGEGLGNQFLAEIREVDALVHVVRCFRDAQVSNPSGSIEPERDMETVETELLLADLETVGRRLERSAAAAKSGRKELVEEKAFLDRLNEALSKGNAASSVATGEDEGRWLAECHLLTAKPFIIVANIGEDALAEGNSEFLEALARAAAKRGLRLVPVCGKLEAELAELQPEERRRFMAEMGLTRSGLEKLIEESYRLLNLVTFYTIAEGKVRAWTVRAGTLAAAAAGKIHSDMEKGFVRAEVIHFDQLERDGSFIAAKQAGRVRMESRDYVVRDGDVITFHFHTGH